MKIETATIRRLRDALLQSGRRASAVLSSSYEILTREGLLSDDESAALTRVDPMAEVMYLMMAADGKITDSERDAVRGAIRGLTDNLLHAGTINVMLDNYASALAAQGREKRLRAIAETFGDNASDAEGAFVLAAAVALADDEVAAEENNLINQLAKWFEISSARASEILDELEEDRDS